ncbi:MAG: WG repeat-containing protein, partial [Saprospiraceae bacterium]|nr:WG repeat-containing protein [Saprospiraceae bacterium]MCF8252621.1 WG repeat-containing protein [Saprospiraceae bacterium]MCF8283110.1 WG repeat-containing protein [Bacteroidales bacterium]MCF8314208.1 WG repeat-containing protein [Saprospiraceae bacterium]MCF8443008.1 WG repeat-containing protein [Saprospiraceae bacterium]
KTEWIYPFLPLAKSWSNTALNTQLKLFFHFQRTALFLRFKKVYGRERKNGKWAVYDIRTLEIITDFEFDKILDVKPEFFVGMKDGFYALYDKEGKPLSNEAFTEPPFIYQKGEFLFGEENQKAIYSAKGARMTPHEFSGMYYLEYRGNNQFYLQANLPKGGYVYFDKNLKESMRAHDLIVCPNSSVAVEQNGLWRIEDSGGNILTDRYYKSLLQIGPNRFYFQFFAAQDTSGTWHVVDIIGRSVHQFEADKVGYLGGRSNLEQLYFSKAGKRYLLEIPGFIAKELKYENGEEGLVELNGKFGFVNRAGKVIIPCEYDNITDVGESYSLNKGLKAAKMGQLYDIYNRYNGEVLIKDVGRIENFGWPNRFFYSKGGKMGEMWPELGKVGVPIYSRFSHQTLGGKSFYIVAYSSADSFAVLDRNMKEVFPPIYSRIQFIEVGNLLLKDFNGKQWVFDGKELQPAGTEYSIVRRFGDKLLIRKNDKFSFVKFNGKLLENLPTGWLENQYQVSRDEYVLRITKDRETYFCYTDGKHRIIGPVQVYKYLEPTTFIIKKASKYGIYDLVDGYLALPNFDTIQEIKDLGYLVKEQGKWGALGKSGQTILPTKFDYAPFVATDHLIARSDGKFRFYTTTGKLIFKESYDYAQAFRAHLAPVCREGKWGYIDKRGNLAIPYQFDYAHTFLSDWSPIAWVMKGDSTYFIDVTGNPTSNLPPGVRRAEDKSNFFDPTLLFPLERQLHSVKIGSYFNFTIFFDTVKKGYGIVSYNGKVLLEPAAQTVKWFGENLIALAWFQQNGKYGFLTKEGEIRPAEYDKYELQDYKSLKVSKGSDDFYLMQDGTIRPISK